MDLHGQAYQALAEKLTKELQEANEEIDKRMHQAHDIHDILTAHLVKHGGVEAALEAAREIDQKFNYGFEFSVDMEYVKD